MPFRTHGRSSIEKALLLLIVGGGMWAGGGLWRALQSSGEVCPQAAADPRPRRIVSLALATDEILIHLVSKERIAALTPFSADPAYSNIADRVTQEDRFLWPDTEVVLRLRPDLVVGASYNDPRFLENLRRLGCPMAIISRFDSFEGIRENVLLVARAVGEEARGLSLLREMDQRLLAAAALGARREKPWQILHITPWGNTAGRGTTQDEVIRLAGGQNVAAELLAGIGRLSSEALLKLRPEVLLRSSFASLDPSLRELFAWQAKRGGVDPLEVVVPSKLLSSVTPYLALAVEELGLALGREARRETR